MIRAASQTDLPAIRKLLVAANDTPYDIGRVADEKCFGRGFFGESKPFVYERDGQLLGVGVAAGRGIRILAVDRQVRRQGIGTALLEHAETLLLGERRVVVAAEAGNYFTPGIVESDVATQQFLMKHSFREFADTWNLTVRLGPKLPMPAGVRRATNADRDLVLEFISQHFGHVWRFEVEHAFLFDPPNVFIVEVDGAIAGFAAHDANNRGLGTFGPTGVASSMRRRGFGRILLEASLADLQRLGYNDVVIPWTDAFEFYRDCCGAEKSHRFVTYAK